jgi:3-oxoacyl-[acyl-carrier-protein] synthase-3
VYFGSPWKNYPAWQAAPRIARELGCDRAFALELDYASCGSPAAPRVAKALPVFGPRVRRVLAGASCESRLADYANGRARSMFNFGGGAVAALPPGRAAIESGDRRISHARLATPGSPRPPPGGPPRPARRARDPATGWRRLPATAPSRSRRSSPAR